MDRSNDYQRIKAAIEYVVAHAADQPDLDAVAAHIGLSPFHLQRLFRHWAGTSPKRFLEYLTVSRAKPLLRDGNSVLETAWRVGLSSPGRLHDQFVALEAVTPGEFKHRGDGLRIAYGLHDGPFGEMLLAATSRGICWLAFTSAIGTGPELARLRACWRGAQLVDDPATTAPLAARIFKPGAAEDRRLHLDVRGTNFQINVWKALLSIPAGAVASYGAMAEYLGKPTASRSVASAIARNPVGYLIPCHRVIRASGELAGFRWGIPLKQLMLTREALQYGGEPLPAFDEESGTR